MTMLLSGVSRISLGRGVQNIFEKVGVFAWREALYATSDNATRLLEGFRGMLPRIIF